MHRFCNLLLAIYITPLYLGKLVCRISFSCICESQNQRQYQITSISLYRRTHWSIRFNRMFKVISSCKYSFRAHMETSLCCQLMGHRPSS